jgi:hypothetical protein
MGGKCFAVRVPREDKDVRSHTWRHVSVLVSDFRPIMGRLMRVQGADGQKCDTARGATLPVPGSVPQHTHSLDVFMSLIP